MESCADVWLKVFVIAFFAGGLIVGIVTYLYATQPKVLPFEDITCDDDLPDPEHDLIVPADVLYNLRILGILVSEFETQHKAKPRRIIVDAPASTLGIPVEYVQVQRT